MTVLLSILTSDIFPVFAIAAIGFLLERRMPGSVKLMSSVTFNALSPCLVFTQMVTTTMNSSNVGRMALYCVLLTAIMGLSGSLASIPLEISGKSRSSFLLVVMFSNSGNYALPVILFAFGREALAYASIYYVTSAVVLYTAGVFIAASGRGNLRQALMGITRVPAIYALALSGAIVLTHVKPPLMLIRPAGMLADAALPMMVLVLGMQLKRAVFPERPARVVVAVALSLIVAPVAGIALTVLLGLSGAAREAAIVLAAMPAAVITTILALEFDLDSSFVTTVVFVSTLLSPFTLARLIANLMK